MCRREPVVTEVGPALAAGHEGEGVGPAPNTDAAIRWTQQGVPRAGIGASLGLRSDVHAAGLPVPCGSNPMGTVIHGGASGHSLFSVRIISPAPFRQAA